MAAVVRTATPGLRAAGPGLVEAPVGAFPAVDRREKSRLARALADDQFPIVVEVAAPRGLDLAETVALARRYRDLGATAVNVPDYPKSGARASALALAVQIERDGPVETLLHYSCRDRNLIGMQSDLVGAHGMGLRNLLLTTGSPAPRANYADATSVFDVDSIGLVNMVARLNQGGDIGGRSIGAPAMFHMGAAVNPFAPSLETEWRRLQHKVDAGAEFLMTPPVFDLEAFDAHLDRLRDTGLPIIAGVAALVGLRQAEFFASEVIGTRMPEALLTRLRDARDEAAEALAIARELVAALRERVHGLQITTAHGSPGVAEQLLADLAGGRMARHGRTRRHA
jgi:homocysteine S-methyltransferase